MPGEVKWAQMVGREELIMAYELLHGRAPLVAHAIEMQCWVKLAERKAKETKGYRVPKMAIKVLEDSFAKLTDVEQAAVLSLTKSHTMPDWHRWDEFCRLFGPSEAARQRRSELGCAPFAIDWVSWVEAHLQLHPEDALTLYELQESCRENPNAASSFSFTRPWKLSHDYSSEKTANPVAETFEELVCRANDVANAEQREMLDLWVAATTSLRPENL
jgi:hypothetical protein